MLVAMLVPSEPERVDGLCPACLTPALWRVSLTSISPAGVGGIVAASTVCDNCGADQASPTT